MRMCIKGNKYFIHGDIAYMLLTNSRELVLVDAIQVPLLENYKSSINNVYGYVYTNSKKAYATMHGLLLGKVPGKESDHINGCKLDNRICNLRHVTRGENTHNSYRANPSGERYIYNSTKGYSVNIWHEHAVHKVGTFATINDAIYARDLTIKDLGMEIPYCGLSSIPIKQSRVVNTDKKRYVSIQLESEELYQLEEIAWSGHRSRINAVKMLIQEAYEKLPPRYKALDAMNAIQSVPKEAVA